MNSNSPKFSSGNSFKTPEFLENLGVKSVRTAKPKAQAQDIVIVSDFDHTLTRNDCGAQVAVLAGLAEPYFFELAKQIGIKNPRLEKGAEFAALMLEDTNLNNAGRAGIVSAIDKIVLKDNVGAMYRALDQGIQGRRVHFYVVSAGPQEAVRGALAKVSVPAGHVIGTRFVYTPEGRPTAVLHASAGKGKVALIEDLKALHNISGKNLIYFGDGSSDIEAMKYVKSEGGYNIAVEDTESLRPYRSMLLKSSDVSDWIAPITKRIATLEPKNKVTFSADVKAFVARAQSEGAALSAHAGQAAA